MKKLLPVIAVTGLSVFLATGCESTLTKVDYSIKDNIESFANDVKNFEQANVVSTTALNKYTLNVEVPVDETITSNEYISPEENGIGNETYEIDEPVENLEEPNETFEEPNENMEQDEDIDSDNETEDPLLENEDYLSNGDTQISTLYSLSDDIENSCGDFCELKEKITNAIIETQSLINKVQNNELDLTYEQKMFISEQSNQLKNIGNELSKVTNELSINLSELSEIFKDENGNIDALSLKYFLILNNLTCGNNMLENSLYSLNMINSLFNLKGSVPPNNYARVLYGFKNNNNPPVIKDFTIAEDGSIVDNLNQEENDQEETKSVNKQTKFKSNIDTYGNKLNNIDTFFNTALLDNEFMYGNGGMMGGFMPYANAYGMRGGYYPYANDKKVERIDETTNSVNNNSNTQNMKKNKKKFKLTKNVDTYRDDNTPTVSAKLGVIKNSISDFFSKFKTNEKEIDKFKEIAKENLKN